MMNKRTVLYLCGVVTLALAQNDRNKVATKILLGKD